MQNIQEWKLWIPRALLPHKAPRLDTVLWQCLTASSHSQSVVFFWGNEEVTTQIAPSQQLFAIHANLLCKWPFSTTYPMRNELCRRSLLPEAVAFGLSSCLSSPFGSKNHDLQIHCFTTVAKFFSWVFQKSQMKTKDVKWYEMICMKFGMPACNSTWTPNLASFCTKRVSKLLHLRDKGKWNRYKTYKTLFQQRKDLLEVTNKVHIKAQR